MTFLRVYCTFPSPVQQIHSSVAMGDPQKILETKTTQDVFFGHPGNPRYVIYWYACQNSHHLRHLVVRKRVPFSCYKSKCLSKS
jgi:hypothetical protein